MGGGVGEGGTFVDDGLDAAHGGFAPDSGVESAGGSFEFCDENEASIIREGDVSERYESDAADGARDIGEEKRGDGHFALRDEAEVSAAGAHPDAVGGACGRFVESAFEPDVAACIDCEGADFSKGERASRCGGNSEAHDGRWRVAEEEGADFFPVGRGLRPDKCDAAIGADAGLAYGGEERAVWLAADCAIFRSNTKGDGVSEADSGGALGGAAVTIRDGVGECVGEGEA